MQVHIPKCSKYNPSQTDAISSQYELSPILKPSENKIDCDEILP